jgi:hypothetical protein
VATSGPLSSYRATRSPGSLAPLSGNYGAAGADPRPWGEGLVAPHANGRPPSEGDGGAVNSLPDPASVKRAEETMNVVSLFG